MDCRLILALLLAGCAQDVAHRDSRGTEIVCFGDSLTYGVLSATPTFLIVSPPGSYPFQLERRLVARYQNQTPVIINEGNPGELASGTGVQRFRDVLLANRPEVVLLMQGTNDLLFGQPGADNAIDALRAMVREALRVRARASASAARRCDRAPLSAACPCDRARRSARACARLCERCASVRSCAKVCACVRLCASERCVSV